MKQKIINFMQHLLNSKIYILFISRLYSFDKLSRYNKSASRVFKEKLFRTYNFSNGAWVETGTYLGETSKYLSNIAQHVYTIEPSKKYFNAAK